MTIERWRVDCNEERPQSSLGDSTHAGFTRQWHRWWRGSWGQVNLIPTDLLLIGRTAERRPLLREFRRLIQDRFGLRSIPEPRYLSDCTAPSTMREEESDTRASPVPGESTGLRGAAGRRAGPISGRAAIDHVVLQGAG
jgi:hypothetical protein